MKICGISDIHGDLNINISECDVLCICGDVINLNDQRDIPASRKWWETRFIKWIETLPCEKVIVIPGNHDFLLERMYNECWGWWKDHMTILSKGKLEFLIDESYEYKGVTFYGTPWIKPILFQESKWAFERDFNEDPLLIPKCDVLLTHDNPYENQHINVSNSHVPYHLFGHCHDGKDNPSLCRFNCSILDGIYNRKKKFKCVIIDIMTDEQRKQIEQEVINNLLKYIKADPLFTLPSSNIIYNHNQKVISLIESFTEANWPVKEDEIPWTESSVITDFIN